MADTSGDSPGAASVWIEVPAWLCLEHGMVERGTGLSCKGRTTFQDWPEQRRTRLPCRFVRLFYVDDGTWAPPEPDVNEERRVASLAEHPYPWNEAGSGTDPQG